MISAVRRAHQPPKAIRRMIATVRTTGPLLGLYPQPPQTFTHGIGARLFDKSGASFLDFNSGIAVNALGHGDKDVAHAVADQATRLIHLSNLYTNEYAEVCASRLVSALANNDWWGPDPKVFFCNSGTEANEAALKFARKHAHITNPAAPRAGILSFTHAFHGRSMGALSATPNLKYQTPFLPLVPHFHTSPFNDARALENCQWDDICGVIVEPMQGEGGVFPATEEFLKELRRKCDQHKAVLIFDEIQCGIGRSGKIFYHHLTSVSPDIVTLAKPLANGIPMGATILRSNVASSIKPGDHGTTFGGNPLATRVACVVLDKINNPEFLGHVRTVSDKLFSRLHVLVAKYPKILKEVRGKGLLVGVEMQGGAQATTFVDLCLEHGNVLVISAGQNTIRMAPPLIISEAEIDIACDVFDKVAEIMNSK
ncbi:acetylornithine aminotransferase [Physocladia obscura]|uniref:acetylornithine transaminase n=1 Tax=Physocladia obscura TaxID=109957 RepID=A0AAD5XHG9_9FUNG|nr:acetylornithine aminotransferase [Physocladia obscura]